jgi:N-hydroxyarylamine O-acetyltransferase
MFMKTGFDLDAYCDRIGYNGSRVPTLDTLQAIQVAHVQRIPFENLNPLLGWPVHLDTVSLQNKLVRDGRGGYCFEQNLLLSAALTTIGFHVIGLAARVLWNAPHSVVTPRDHMLLLIDLDDEAYVADVGFGGSTPTAPLRLQPGIEQATPHEPFRLIRRGETFVMEAKIGTRWQALYRFELQEQFLPDYEVTNWYVSTHPDSHFVTGLSAARADSNVRFALRNNELAIHRLNGETERHRLASADELLDTLGDVFRLTLPAAPELRSAVERLVARAA